jgi:hypothetical protein
MKGANIPNAFACPATVFTLVLACRTGKIESKSIVLEAIQLIPSMRRNLARKKVPHNCIIGLLRAQAKTIYVILGSHRARTA